MYGSDILCGISKDTFEIPHKISYPYIESCRFYPRDENLRALRFKSSKVFQKRPPGHSEIKVKLQKRYKNAPTLALKNMFMKKLTKTCLIEFNEFFKENSIIQFITAMNKSYILIILFCSIHPTNEKVLCQISRVFVVAPWWPVQLWPWPRWPWDFTHAQLPAGWLGKSQWSAWGVDRGDCELTPR